MKNLYAIYIAINDYPQPVNPLKGCVRDADLLCEYITDRYASQFSQQIKKIVNQEATRANIIASFEHFDQAQDGDTCLFYFAGHGSRMSAPVPFQQLDSDGKLQTLVGYDSRLKGGRDLIDKELSYLIWKATKDKDIHFLSIMDCCHSGSNTRGEEDAPTVIGVRETRAVSESVGIQQFLGFEHYKKDHEGKWTAPRGNAIALSACLSSQTAKEVYSGGQARGVFTYFLIQTLKEIGGSIDYNNLIAKVNTNVSRFVKEQSPQLESKQYINTNLGFLSQEKWDGKRTYLVHFDKKLKKWVLNAGVIHGLTRGTNAMKTTFEIIDSDQKITLAQVQSTYSIVEGMVDYNRKQVYEATLLQLGINKLKIALGETLSSEQMRLLQTAYAKKEDWQFEFIDTKGTPNLLLTSSNSNLYLHSIGILPPLFEGLKIEEIDLFLERIQAVAKWENNLKLCHPNSNIDADDIALSLYRLTEAANYEPDAPKEEHSWKQSLRLPYLQKGEAYHHPAFQLKIKNNSEQTYWISALYFQRNFAIHNELLPKAELAAEQEMWLEIQKENYPSRTLEVQVEHELIELGLHKVREYLKLFVSTKEFNTNGFTQDALPQEIQQSKRDSVSVVAADDWDTRELVLEIGYFE